MRLYDLIDRMAVDRKWNPVRQMEAGREMWRAGPNGECVNRIVKAALRDGLMVGHYPTGRASAELTDKGREAAQPIKED